MELGSVHRARRALGVLLQRRTPLAPAKSVRCVGDGYRRCGCTFLVFLHLLESQTKPLGEFRLGQTKHQAAHAQSFSDVRVSWVWSVLWHSIAISLAPP